MKFDMQDRSCGQEFGFDWQAGPFWCSRVLYRQDAAKVNKASRGELRAKGRATEVMVGLAGCAHR